MPTYRHPETGDRAVPAEDAYVELLEAQGYEIVGDDDQGAGETELERLRAENARLRAYVASFNRPPAEGADATAPEPAPIHEVGGEPVEASPVPAPAEETA